MNRPRNSREHSPRNGNAASPKDAKTGREKGKVPRTTSSGNVTIKSSASDPSGIARVRYRVGKGAFKTAVGTTAWKLSAKLEPGKNTIEIVTIDSFGSVSAAKRVKVTRE